MEVASINAEHPEAIVALSRVTRYVFTAHQSRELIYLWNAPIEIQFKNIQNLMGTLKEHKELMRLCTRN